MNRVRIFFAQPTRQLANHRAAVANSPNGRNQSNLRLLTAPLGARIVRMR